MPGFYTDKIKSIADRDTLLLGFGCQWCTFRFREKLCEHGGCSAEDTSMKLVATPAGGIYNEVPIAKHWEFSRHSSISTDIRLVYTGYRVIQWYEMKCGGTDKLPENLRVRLLRPGKSNGKM